MANKNGSKQSEADLLWDEFNEKLGEWFRRENASWSGFCTLTLDLSECDFTDGAFPAKELIKLQQTDEWAIEELEMYLCEFPNGELLSFVCEMKWLKKLNLCGSNVSKIPAEFANLQRLEALRLDNCDDLHCFPKAICGCKSLKMLDLEYSFLKDKTLPDEFENLQSLEELNICGSFSEFPQVLLRLKSLKSVRIDEELIDDKIDKELKNRGIAWSRGY